MTRRLALTLGFSLAASAAAAGAQQAMPPVHPIGPIEHVTTTPMKAVSAVRELPGGRVLVNDVVDHRVLLFDSTLANPTAVADSTSSTANAYGNMPGGLIPYRGDSTLFIDPASLSMLVLDGAGKIARVMSVPHPNEAIFLIGGPFGTSGFDPAGRLVYRGNTLRMTARAAGKGDQDEMLPQFPDSAPIVRVTLATRAEDTVAFFKIPPTKMSVRRTGNGGFVATSTINPMPVVDDWALLPDGTVAIVRGRDFHIDWVHPDGTRASTPKIPFDWQRLTDDEKAAVIDSAKQVLEKRRADRIAALTETRTATSAGTERRVTASAGGDGGGGAMGGMVMIVRKDGGDGNGGAAPPTRGGSNAQITMPPLQFVPPYELPDYRPAFTAGATTCDLQGNLWIRTSQATDGQPVYDVVNEQGVLVDRVQLPAFRTIAGFGHGVVYMGVTDSTGAVHLERARLNRK